MDKRTLFIVSVVLFLACTKSRAFDRTDEEYPDESRGFLKAGSSWLTLLQNYTATKTALLTTLLNATNPFKTNKVTLLATLYNATADLANLKLLKKFSNSTLALFNTTSTFLTNYLAAKVAFKNSTAIGKLQFLNASSIALTAALEAKLNQTSKLSLLSLFNATNLLAFKLAKKNLSLLLADSVDDQLLDLALMAKLNETALNPEDEYDDTADPNDYQQVDYELEYV